MPRTSSTALIIFSSPRHLICLFCCCFILDVWFVCPSSKRVMNSVGCRAFTDITRYEALYCNCDEQNSPLTPLLSLFLLEQDCIDKWLHSQNKCPMCKTPIS